MNNRTTMAEYIVRVIGEKSTKTGTLRFESKWEMKGIWLIGKYTIGWDCSDLIMEDKGMGTRREVFVTEPDIILECLFEVYQMEASAILSEKNIRHTMVYVFLKMLQREFSDYTLEELHKALWRIFETTKTKVGFVRKGLYNLKQEVVEI